MEEASVISHQSVSVLFDELGEQISSKTLRMESNERNAEYIRKRADVQPSF